MSETFKPSGERSLVDFSGSGRNPNDAAVDSHTGTSSASSVPAKLFDIVFEDEHMLVLNKPAGLVCHPTKADRYSSLISRIRLYLGGAIHAQMVNRLDRETSGVVLVAKDEDTARQLRRIWESRCVEKCYLAIVHGFVPESHGMIDAPLGKDVSSRIAIKDCVCPGGAPSQTEFWLERHLFVKTSSGESRFSLLRLRPHTGRKHQIRIHLAHFGHPIVGDKLYGGDDDLYMALVEDRLTERQREQLVFANHALHANSVRFSWNEATVLFEAPPERWFANFLISARGAEPCPIPESRAPSLTSEALMTPGRIT